MRRWCLNQRRLLNTNTFLFRQGDSKYPFIEAKSFLVHKFDRRILELLEKYSALPWEKRKLVFDWNSPKEEQQYFARMVSNIYRTYKVEFEPRTDIMPKGKDLMRIDENGVELTDEDLIDPAVLRRRFYSGELWDGMIGVLGMDAEQYRIVIERELEQISKSPEFIRALKRDRVEYEELNQYQLFDEVLKRYNFGDLLEHFVSQETPEIMEELAPEDMARLQDQEIPDLKKQYIEAMKERIGKKSPTSNKRSDEFPKFDRFLEKLTSVEKYATPTPKSGEQEEGDSVMFVPKGLYDPKENIDAESARLASRMMHFDEGDGFNVRDKKDIFPELLTPEQKEENEVKKLAEELLKYKLYKLDERMKEKPKKEKGIYVDGTGMFYPYSVLSEIDESHINMYYSLDADDLLLFGEGVAGKIPHFADTKRQISMMIRRPAFLAMHIMKTHALGKKLLIKPRNEMKGVGVSYCMNLLALFSKHMGWLTIFVPSTRKLVQNHEVLQVSPRDPFFMDQPLVAKSFVENLVNGQRPALEQFKLKKNYSTETHGYSIADILSARKEGYEPISFESSDACSALSPSSISAYFKKEKSAMDLANEIIKLEGLKIKEDSADCKSDDEISLEDVTTLSKFIQSSLVDSKWNPEYTEDTTKESTEDSNHPTLYDLAVFGLQSENMEEIIGSIAVDILHEIRLNDDPSKIATVIIDEANWFDGKTLFRHPDTFKRLPARRMSFQNALAQYLENPPKFGFSVLGISPEIDYEKSLWWMKDFNYSFYVDRYSKEEVNKVLTFFASQGLADGRTIFGNYDQVLQELQAATGFRAKEMDDYAYAI